MRAAALLRQPKTHPLSGHILASARRTNACVRLNHMAQSITLTSAHDGFELAALSARPPSEPIGGVVVIQEIFGLTEHVREMCAVFADAGYAVLAPGLFERVERNFQATLDGAGIDKGRSAVMASSWPQVVADVQAAIGREQLKRLDAMLERRRVLAARYNERLSEVPGLALPEEPPWAKSNWQSYCVKLPERSLRRGVNRIALFEVTGPRELARLAP